MKKWGKKIRVLPAIIILAIVISSCNNNITEILPEENIEAEPIVFEDITHNRSDESLRMYKALATIFKGVTYEIEASCVNNEEEAKRIIESIDADVIGVMGFFEGMDLDAPTIMVVAKDILGGQDLVQSYHYNNKVITTIEYIQSGEYVNSLVGAILNNDIPWINYGLAGQFRNSDINISEISAYLDNANNIEVLDFFGARFYKTITNNDSDKMIAISEVFIEYYINTYGKSNLLNYITNDEKTDLIKEKNEWLDHLDLKQRYTNDTNIIFQNFKFSKYSNYDFMIDSPYATYRIKMNAEDKYVLSSVEKLKYFLTKNIFAIKEVKNLLSNTISNKELIEFDSIPIYDINEAEYPLDAYSDTSNNIIIIHGPLLEYSHIHEYVHTILPFYANEDSILDDEIINEYRYFAEGAACYITSSVNNEYSCHLTDFDTYEHYNCYQALTKNIIESCADGTHIFESVSEFGKAFESNYLVYYMNHATDFTEFSDFSMKIFSDAYSYARFVMMEQYPTVEVFDYAVYESFVGYLADKYSLEQVIQALDNYDEIQAIFGKTFNELQVEWKEYLLEP